MLALTEKIPWSRTTQRNDKKWRSSRGKRSDASGTNHKASVTGSAIIFVIAANDAVGIERGYWILDSGVSRHLFSDERLLLNAKDCNDEVSLADGEKLKLTKVGDVRLHVIADGKERTVLLTNV